MPSDDQSVFSPPPPQQQQDYSGPFSKWTSIQQNEQKPIQPPPAYPGKGAAIAYGIEKFVEGIRKGRVAKFAQQEQQKNQQWKSFQSYVNLASNNKDLSQAAKDEIAKTFYQTYGAAAKSEMGEASKGGKGKKGGGDPNDPNNKHGLIHHAMGTLLDGMTGGKPPSKGGPDFSEVQASIQSKYFNPDGSVKPEYSKTKALSDITQKYGEATKGATTEQDQQKAAASLFPHLVSQFGGDVRAASEFQKEILPKLPSAGSQADILQQWKGIGQPASGSPASPPPSPQAQPPSRRGPASRPATPIPPGTLAAPPAGPVAQAANSTAGPATGPTPPAAPNSRVLSPVEMQIAQMAGASGPLERLEYDGPDGKPVRVMGREINLPSGSGFYDASGRQIPADPSKVRKGSSAEPRQPRAPTTEERTGEEADEAYRARHKMKPGAPLDGAQHEDAVAEWRGRMASSTRRPSAPRQESAATVEAGRKVKAMEAISKIIEQTPIPANMGATQFAEYLRQHIEQYYKNDKSVAPYSAEIYNWINEEARKGSFKDPNALKSLIQGATGQAKQEHQAAKAQDKIEDLSQQVQANVDEIMGSQGGQGETRVMTYNPETGTVE